MQPRLIVEQKITAFVNRYDIFRAQADGSKGELLAFAQQKRLAFKEKVTFYSDEQKTQEVFGFRAEKVLDVHGRYLVEDAAGSSVGSFKKEFKQSLLSSTWSILGPNDEPLITVTESSKLLAVFRRFIGFVPIIGDFGELIVMFFKYHFILTDVRTGQEVGQYRKTTLLRDHYQLSMTDQAYAAQDWRVLAAVAVALDALQSR